MGEKHQGDGKQIFVRLRCIIIHDGKLLVTYTKPYDFYFFPGGHMEFGETVMEGVKREIKEELGDDVEFEFKKILYIREFLERERGKHSLELFILGEINKFEELEGKIDPEHPDGDWWTTWVDINNLPNDLRPRELAVKLREDYKNGFPNQGEYVGEM